MRPMDPLTIGRVKTLSEEPRIIDGADRRKNRLLELLRYIHGNGGATLQEMKSYMTIRFGLRHETAAKYIMELHMAGLIKPEGLKWFTTTECKRLAPDIYS